MAVDYRQTDTQAACAAGQYCGLATANTANDRRQATSGGTAGTTQQTITIDNLLVIGRAFYCEVVIPEGTTWDAGTWTVRFNCTTASMGVTLERIDICRVNSSCTNQASIGSASTLGIDLSSTGVKSANVTGASQTPSAGDKVMILYALSNTNSHGTSTIGWTPDQLITAPFTAPVSGIIRGSRALMGVGF